MVQPSKVGRQVLLLARCRSSVPFRRLHSWRSRGVGWFRAFSQIWPGLRKQPSQSLSEQTKRAETRKGGKRASLLENAIVRGDLRPTRSSTRPAADSFLDPCAQFSAPHHVRGPKRHHHLQPCGRRLLRGPEERRSERAENGWCLPFFVLRQTILACSLFRPRKTCFFLSPLPRKTVLLFPQSSLASV